MSRKDNIRRMLAPRHVAFIGGDWASNTLRNCVAFGFEGEIWYVHPRKPPMDGVAVFASVEELPEAPDCAYVAVSAEVSIGVVRALAERGAGGCVCYAAGFAEMGGEGVALQERLVAAAGDMAVLGPNCYGMLDYRLGLHVWTGGLLERYPGPGAALVSQSGALLEVILLGKRHAPIVAAVSIGNQAVLGVEDIVDAYLDDPGVNVIGVYLEGLRDAVHFSEVAARALERGVPIVAIKSGASETGARLTLGHTSSLAGEDALYQAFFDRLGIIRVDSLSQFLETTKLLSFTGGLASRRFAAVTVSGGGAALVADYAARLGLEPTAFTPEQVARLEEKLPEFVNCVNPFDITVGGLGDAGYAEVIFDTVVGGDVDIVAIMLDGYELAEPGDFSSAPYTEMNELLLAAMDRALVKYDTWGIVMGCIPETLPRYMRDRARDSNMIPMQGLEDMMVAIADAARYTAARRDIEADGGPSRRVLAKPTVLSGTAHTFDEAASKQMLVKAGITVAPSRVAKPDEVVEAAAALGFPVVLKVLEPIIAHKTEAGAVAVGLADRDAVQSALDAMCAALTPVRFLVERQIEGAVVELILGIKHDPLFGHALVIGAGGVLVELVEDSVSLLLPTTRHAVEQALAGLKVSRLLQGFRGRPVADRDAVIDAALALAELASAERDRVREIEVNPLLVLSQGQGAVAVDALVTLS